MQHVLYHVVAYVLMSVSAIDEREEDYSTHVNKLQSSLKFQKERNSCRATFSVGVMLEMIWKWFRS